MSESFPYFSHGYCTSTIVSKRNSDVTFQQKKKQDRLNVNILNTELLLNNVYKCNSYHKEKHVMYSLQK
jgi:hypothetical protein